MTDHPEWHGHRLRSLPPGERWLSGAARPQQAVPAARPLIPWDDDPWPFEGPDGLEARATSPTAGDRARGHGHPAAARAGSRRGTVILLALGLAAVITILVGGRTGSPPASNPATVGPPAHVVGGLTTDHLVRLQVHVGDYVQLQLPEDHAYTPAVEQPSNASPVIEALNLPGQLPELRADGVGHAVVQITQEPDCSAADSCPDQRKWIGGVDVTVTP